MGFKKTVSMDTTAGLPSKGIHVAKCVEADLQPIKNGPNKGEDNLVLTFAIETKGQVGRRVRSWEPLLASTRWRYSRTFQAFGLKAAAGKPDIDIKDTDFVGKRVRLKIDHEEYEGETRARIELIMPLGEGKSKLVEDDAADEDGSAAAATVESADDDEFSDDSDAADDLPF